MNASESFYDWLDRKTRDNIEEVVRLGCGQQIVNALGTLAGLGIPRRSLLDLVERTLEATERMLGVVRDDLSAGQNMDAVIEQAALESERNEEDQRNRRKRGLLRICRSCRPPTGIEQKTIGILHGWCDSCGRESEGPDLIAYGLQDVLSRLAQLEESRQQTADSRQQTAPEGRFQVSGFSSDPEPKPEA